MPKEPGDAEVALQRSLHPCQPTLVTEEVQQGMVDLFGMRPAEVVRPAVDLHELHVLDQRRQAPARDIDGCGASRSWCPPPDSADRNEVERTVRACGCTATGQGRSG